MIVYCDVVIIIPLFTPLQVAKTQKETILCARAHLMLGWGWSLMARSCRTIEKKVDLQNRAVNEYTMQVSCLFFRISVKKWLAFVNCVNSFSDEFAFIKPLFCRCIHMCECYITIPGKYYGHVTVVAH